MFRNRPRFRFHGDKRNAESLYMQAWQFLEAMKPTCPGLPQKGPFRRVFQDGTEFVVREIFGQGLIDVYVPVVAEGRELKKQDELLRYYRLEYRDCYGNIIDVDWLYNNSEEAKNITTMSYDMNRYVDGADDEKIITLEFYGFGRANIEVMLRNKDDEWCDSSGIFTDQVSSFVEGNPHASILRANTDKIEDYIQYLYDVKFIHFCMDEDNFRIEHPSIFIYNDKDRCFYFVYYVGPGHEEFYGTNRYSGGEYEYIPYDMFADFFFTTAVETWTALYGEGYENYWISRLRWGKMKGESDIYWNDRWYPHFGDPFVGEYGEPSQDLEDMITTHHGVVGYEINLMDGSKEFYGHDYGGKAIIYCPRDYISDGNKEAYRDDVGQLKSSTKRYTYTAEIEKVHTVAKVMKGYYDFRPAVECNDDCSCTYLASGYCGRYCECNEVGNITFSEYPAISFKVSALGKVLAEKETLEDGSGIPFDFADGGEEEKMLYYSNPGQSHNIYFDTEIKTNNEYCDVLMQRYSGRSWELVKGSGNNSICGVNSDPVSGSKILLTGWDT